MTEKQIEEEAIGFAMESNAYLHGDVPAGDDTDIIEDIKL